MNEMSIEEVIYCLKAESERYNDISCKECRFYHGNDHCYDNAIDKAIEALMFKQTVKECLTEDAFNLISSSSEEIKAWIERMIWHCKRADELAREKREYQQKVQRCIQRIYEEQQREFENNEVVMGDMHCYEIIEIIKEEMGVRNEVN